MNYKTLILMDNSLSMGEGNLAIEKAVVKYIAENLDEDDEISIGTFGESTEIITDYGSSLTEVLTAIDSVTLINRETYITDTVMEVIEEWKNNDFACRNLLIVSDGGEAESLLHADAELYHILDDSEYPVYFVGCMREGTKEARNMSAIATISDGIIAYTEYDGSEASVEITVGDKILSAFADREASENEDLRQSGYDFENNGDSEYADGVYYDGDVYTDGSYEDLYYDGYAENYTENEIYNDEYLSEGYAEGYMQNNLSHEEHNRTDSFFIILFPAVSVLIIAVMIIAIISGRRRRKGAEQHDLSMNERFQTERNNYSDRLFGNREKNRIYQEFSDGETRLLSQSVISHDIILEDVNNPTKLFRTSCRDGIIIGRHRNTCDIVIDYDDSVSGRHCEIAEGPGGWYVRDLGSLNGTKVNDRKVFQEVKIQSGDTISLGKITLIVTIK